MDASLTPPLRIQAQNVQQIPSQVAQKRLGSFINQLRARNLSKNAGETTAAVQLQKLSDALREEHSERD